MMLFLSVSKRFWFVALWDNRGSGFGMVMAVQPEPYVALMVVTVEKGQGLRPGGALLLLCPLPPLSCLLDSPLTAGPKKCKSCVPSSTSAGSLVGSLEILPRSFSSPTACKTVILLASAWTALKVKSIFVPLGTLQARLLFHSKIYCFLQPCLLNLSFVLLASSVLSFHIQSWIPSWYTCKLTSVVPVWMI